MWFLFIGLNWILLEASGGRHGMNSGVRQMQSLPRALLPGAIRRFAPPQAAAIRSRCRRRDEISGVDSDFSLLRCYSPCVRCSWCSKWWCLVCIG